MTSRTRRWDLVTTLSARDVRSRWPSTAQMEQAARRVAVVSLAGALSGLLVAGIGGRLAMMLLANLSPEATGLVSDDGFVMGQFTLSGTLNLFVAATFLGLVGSGIYAVLRPLMIGPRWFQVLSVSMGPAVVVGALLVHTDGVDFTYLRPPALAIALFVAIPGLYAALLTVLSERWLLPESRLLHVRRRAGLFPLVLWLPFAPVLLIGALGWVLVERMRGQPATRALVENPIVPWLARLALTVTFAVYLTELVNDVAVLT